MKNLKKYFLPLLAALCLACGAAAFSACAKEPPLPEENTATLTLDAGEGGTLAQNTYSVKVGTPLADFLADKSPVPQEGLSFEGWYSGTAKLKEGATMPDAPLTLGAKYLAGYTVDLYLEDVEGNFPAAPQKKEGTAIFGEPFTYSEAIEHFTLDTEESVLNTGRLTAGAVFEAYYTRDRLFVSYAAGLGSTQSYAESVVYGKTVTLYDGALFETPQTQRFVGWSSSLNGEPEHFAGEQYAPQSDVVFYAVWDVAYTDRFGGGDLIFFPQREEGVALLVRNGEEYRGVHDGGKFSFTTEGGTLAGEVNGSLFAYLREDAAGEYLFYSGYYNERDEHLLPDRKLTLDGYLNAVYTYPDANGTVIEEKGTYSASEGGVYTFYGENGTGFSFMLSQREGTPVFSVLGNEAGDYVQFVPLNAEGRGITGDYTLELDGYGNCTLGVPYLIFLVMHPGTYYIDSVYETQTSEGTAYSYKIVAMIPNTPNHLLGPDDVAEVALYTVPLRGADSVMWAFVLRDGNATGVFAGEEDGGETTLTLDGMGQFEDSAVYRDGGEVYRGTFFSHESEIFGTLVEFTAVGGQRFTFRLYESESGEKRFERFDENYTEYWLLHESNGYGSLTTPVLVVYEEAAEEGRRAELYERTGDAALQHIASGYVTSRDIGGGLLYYSFTRTSLEEGYVDGDVWASFEFLVAQLTSTSGIHDVYYLFRTNGEAVYIPMREEVEEGERGGLLWFASVGVNGMGGLYFAADGSVLEGSFSWISNNFMSTRRFLQFRAYTPTGYQNYYFEVFTHTEGQGVDAEYTYTFARLAFAPMDLFRFELLSDGTHYNGSDVVYLDGRGGASFLKDGRFTDAEAGSYRATDLTVFGETVYTYTADEGDHTFSFVIKEDTYSFCHFREEMSGTFTDGSSVLRLDGYHRAEYTADGQRIRGEYYFTDPASVQFTADESGKVYAFALDGDGFVLRDAAYGTYRLVDINGDAYRGMQYTLAWDGFGSLEVREGENVVAIGKYQLSDAAGGQYRMRVIWEDGEKVYTVRLSEGSCTVFEESAQGSFVSPSWTQLRLDGLGGGYYIDGFGIRHSGTYRLFDADFGMLAEGDSHFYFVLDGNGKFHISDNTASYGTYYAGDFTAVIVGEQIRYEGVQSYYHVENGTAFLYTADETASPYRYKKSSFPFPAGDSCEIGGKTYYRYGGGEIVLHDRDNGLELRFTPGAPDTEHGAEIDVRATLNGKDGFGFYVAYSEDALETYMLSYYYNNNAFGFLLQTGFVGDNEENTFSLQGAQIYRNQAGEYIIHTPKAMGYWGREDSLLAIMQENVYTGYLGSVMQGGTYLTFESALGDFYGLFVFDGPDNFRLVDNSGYDLVYLAEEDLASIVMGQVLYINGRLHYYFVEDGKIYLVSADGNTQIPMPAGDTYEYEGQTYYRWNGEEIRMTGTLRWISQQGVQTMDDVALSFTPNAVYDLRAPATLGGYSGFTLQVKYSRGVATPYLVYGETEYRCAVMKYRPGGAENGFIVEARDTSITRRDAVTGGFQNGGIIMDMHAGVGPISMGSEQYIFVLNYELADNTYFEMMQFVRARSELSVVGHSEEYGDLYETLIPAFVGSEQVTYSMRWFFSSATEYILESIARYTEFDTGEYIVKTREYLHSNAFSIYAGCAAGDIIDVRLYRKSGDEAVFIEPETVNVNVEKFVTYRAKDGTSYRIRYTFGQTNFITGAEVNVYT